MAVSNGQPATAHFVLQGKGGVGKSYVSSLLAQYFEQKGKALHCLDTDPVNATFAQYQRLKAQHLNILRRGTVYEKRFDELVDRICAGEGVFIVDTGATTFVPLWNYVVENEILQFLQRQGRPVIVHALRANIDETVPPVIIRPLCEA
jgi:MinD-like ATPase involved in chromosome partitioning or flagellar assembly